MKASEKTRLEQIQEKIANKYNSDIERIAVIYQRTPDIMVQPRIYDVTETDFSGRYNDIVLTFELVSPKNPKDIALDLYEKKRYLSPWNDLRIQEHTKSNDFIKI